MFTQKQKEILLSYTNDLDSVTSMSHYEYANADSKKVSKLLDDYHVIWFHDDPGKMYLVKREK